MGGLVLIHCRDESLIEAVKADPLLAQEIGWQTESDVLAWLNEINNDPKSPQRHLKPAGRYLDLAELQRRISVARFPFVCFDCYFQRTSEAAMRRMLELALEYVETINEIEGSYRDWWERCGIEDTAENRRTFFPVSRKCARRLWPRLAPLRKRQARPEHYSRAYPARHYPDREVRVVFANVDRCKFVRDNEFYDYYDNPPMKDAQGNRYMLVPLVPLGPGGERVANHIYGELSMVADVSIKQFAKDWNLEVA